MHDCFVYKPLRRREPSGSRSVGPVPALSADQALVYRRHKSCHLLSNRHLRRSDDDMPLPRFLSLPGKNRRSRSKARSEADASKDPTEAGQPVPRPAGSALDLEVGSSTSTTATHPTLQNQESSGTRAMLSWNTHLTALPQTPDNADPDHTQSVTKKAKRPKPWNRILNRNTATSETKSESSLGSTVYASAKVVIDVVKESSDVFPPLKSVASGLSVVLKHYDV